MLPFALVVVVLALVLSGALGQSAGRRAAAARAAGRHRSAALVPAVEAGLLPWRLPTPLSREVVLPGAPNRLLVVGGLLGSVSERGILEVGMAGRSRAIGSLPAGVHDAAGAVVAGQGVVFGGGSPTTVAGVERFTPPSAPGHLGPYPGSSASSSGQLPQPRSDASAATIGSTAYIVGGYDGARADQTILATSDGRSFRSVAQLPVAVRYPAVAALSGKLYVFGGEAISGARSGHPVDDIQIVDPGRRFAAVIGHLPQPLEAAAAVTLGGHIYLAGGDSSVPSRTGSGVGSTQLSPPVGAAGPSGLFTVGTISAFDPARRRMRIAGRLQVPVSHAGVAVLGSRAWLVGGETGGTQQSVVQMMMPNPAFGSAGASGAGSPYFGGRLLVADRANNRFLLLDPAMHIRWRFPSRGQPRDKHGFFFPDDAFFVHHGTAIISNQEENETVEEIAFPSGRVIWSYGHRRQPGSALGFLHEPDDAYLLRNGQITVADADNCRVLVIRPNHTVAHQIGTVGACAHTPPHDIGSPNGDTPLANGDLLVSEITGTRVSEYTRSGRLVWSRVLPITYPSDPQQLGPDRYLIADYATPGQLLMFNRAGRILYRYDVASGPGRLNHPSLVEHLPSGVLMVNDDYRDRMVAIDPVTKALVWQYGVTDHGGTGPGQLRVPDGFDVLMTDGTTPTHPQTG